MSAPRLHRRTAGAHPWLLTFVFCGSWALMYAAAFTVPAWRHSAAFLSFPIAVVCFWYWGIYKTARDVRSNPKRTLPSWAFAVPPVFILIAGLAGWATDNSPAAFAFFLLLGVVLWFTADALDRADSADGASSFWSVFGMMILLYIALVGAWGLAPRIKRVLAKSEP